MKKCPKCKKLRVDFHSKTTGLVEVWGKCIIAETISESIKDIKRARKKTREMCPTLLESREASASVVRDFGDVLRELSKE